MEEVKATHEVNSLLDFYNCKYKERYGRFPMRHTTMDVGALEYVMRRTDYDITKQMLEVYFRLNGQKPGDNWFKEQGHNIATFKNKIEFLYAYSADESEEKTKYIVGFTDSGEPVTDSNPRAAINGFPVTDFNKWLNMDAERRFLIPKERWAKLGVDIITWAETFKKY